MNKELLFNYDLINDITHSSLQHYLDGQNKEELISQFLTFFKQNQLLYTKLNECQQESPKWFTEYLGINNQNNSKSSLDWLNTYIKIIEETSNIAQVDMCVLADLKADEPLVYETLIKYRKKWVAQTHCDYYPLQLIGEK